MKSAVNEEDRQSKKRGRKIEGIDSETTNLELETNVGRSESDDLKSIGTVRGSKTEGIDSRTAENKLETIGGRSEDKIKPPGQKVKCRILSKIWLLVWKNLIFRKRHYIATSIHIILPTLLAIGLVAQRSLAPKEEKGLDSKGNTMYPVFPESMLITVASARFSDCFSTCVIAYAPDNALTQGIMENVKRHLPTATFDLRGFPDDSSIEKYLPQLIQDLVSSQSVDDLIEVKAAVVFESGVNSNPPFSRGHSISYKIRLVDQGNLENTGELMPGNQIPGPVDGNARKYRDAGFTGLQIAVDKSIIETLTSQQPTQAINVQAFPYPPFTRIVNYNTVYSTYLPEFIMFGFVFVIPGVIMTIIAEKKTGIKELMKMMGLPNWAHWLGWMLHSMSVVVVSITILTVLFFVPWSAAGALLIYTDPFLFWIILVLYAMAATTFCFLISTFFQSPAIGLAVGILLWMVTYSGPVNYFESKYSTSILLHEKVLSALLPNVALSWLMKIIGGFEGKSVGTRWSNLFEGVSSVDNLSVGLICVMLILDMFLYTALAAYFENIIPSEYGLRKPWYYIFKPSACGFGTGSPARVASNSNAGLSSDTDAPGFETAPDDLKAGVVMKDLKKSFGKNKMVVDGLNLKFYHGQITALLGHNGAGKTTTMSMLTGLISPSSGYATVNGYDIRTQMDEVQMNMGLCPQHNMLFNDLTVEEHLIFFGRLKGLSTANAKSEMSSLLEKLQLADKRTVLSKSLSGGQKRKLCLGMALIGGTSVVVLDEPTSGMDVEARRSVWDLLFELRGDRTIVLTTHFMEEADVLGDRIAIMADGKIKCCGSPMFLKKFYGAGYTLRLTLSDPSPAHDLLGVIQKHIPNASLQKSAANASEVGFTIPNEPNTNSVFPALFSELSERKAEFGIETLGLSLTTMEEVFIKVGEKDTAEIRKEVVETTANEILSSENPDFKLFDGKRLSGLKLSFQQFHALIQKKKIYTYRKWILSICQFFIPILLVILTILQSNRVFSPPSAPPFLRMDLSMYRNPITLYKSTDNALGESFASVVGKSARKSSSADIIGELLAASLKDLGVYREQYIVGGDFSSTSLTALFSTIPNHASPLAVNLVSNTILKSTSGNQDYSIQVSTHPLQSNSFVQSATPDPTKPIKVAGICGALLPLGLALFSACYVVFPLEEKLSNGKQLQLMTGVSPCVYWTSCFTFDFLMMTMLVSLMVLCFPIFQSYGAFTAYNGGGVIYLVLIVYGFSSISFSYLFSLLMGSIPGGFALIATLHLFTGVLLSTLIFFFELEFGNTSKSLLAFSIIGSFDPAFRASTAIMRFATIVTHNSKCNIVPEDVKKLICDPRLEIEPRYRECCKNCASLPNVKCFTPESYLTWNFEFKNLNTEKSVPGIPGIGQDLLYLFIIGIVSQLILMFFEYGIANKIAALVVRTKTGEFRSQTEDEDVKAEDERVKRLVSSGRCSEDALVVYNLRKNYGSLAAVSGLSFGVHHGECFGMLGVNGAGKTTAFRMLTGDEIRSDGNAFANNYTLDKNRKRFLSLIGYCPQFDGIVDVLTGEEMLNLFGSLRGIQSQFVKQESKKWLLQLGLSDAGNSRCGKYSGGMKRRLSAAMALIGDPPIILLDEPTTGVDPIGRREFWKVISLVQKGGQSCVLTSHSMEECEALCSRLGIMVNGAFQCLGGVQHLKQKFAQGYSIVIKLRGQNADGANHLMQMIEYKFSPCVLKDKHQNVLQYQVLNTVMSWGDLFAAMEDIKSSFNSIEDYAVSETTLEQVFLSFARKQYPSRDTQMSLCRKIVTCSCCQ